jgi:hypothetical protein
MSGRDARGPEEMSGLGTDYRAVDARGPKELSGPSQD